jgi:hypothetical protein
MKLLTKTILVSRNIFDTDKPKKITITKLFGITISETKEYDFESNTEITY